MVEYKGLFNSSMDCYTQNSEELFINCNFSSSGICKAHIHREDENSLESFKDLWQLIQNYCRENISDVAYNCFISGIEPISLSAGEVTLFVKTDFHKKIISENYLKLFKEAFENVCGFSVEFVIISEEETNSELLSEKRINTSHNKGFSDTTKTHYDYTFDTFIVGPTNKFAHAAAQSVASNPGKSYNPLFIYGNSGLGKTHLLNAICCEIRKNNPDAVIIFTTGEDFTNEFINHLRNNSANVFHEKYRNVDVFLIDDIQFIAKKEQTEEEFFHTFDTLFQNHKQIVLTADRPPRELIGIEERLISRFEWGLIADVQSPEFETRIAIIKRKAELLNLEIPDNVVEFIAEKIKKNIRQLEGVVRKLHAYCLIDNATPSIQTAQTAIKDLLSDNRPIGTTIKNIITEVARTIGVPEAKIISKDKTAKVSFARQVSMYIIREMTGISMKDIGSYFDGRDYSTSIYAINQIQKKLKTDSSLGITIENIIKNVSEL